MEEKKELDELDFEDLDEIRKDFMVRIFSYVIKKLQDRIKLNASKLLYLFNVEGRKDRAEDTNYYPAFYTEEGIPYYIKQEKEKRTQEEKEHEILDEMRIFLKKTLSDEKKELIKNLKEDDVHNKLRKMVRCNILKKKKGGSSGKKDYYYFQLDEFKFSLFQDMITKDHHVENLKDYSLNEIERFKDHNIYGIQGEKYDSVKNLKEKIKFLIEENHMDIKEEVKKRKENVIEKEFERHIEKLKSKKLKELLSKFNYCILDTLEYNFKRISDIYSTLSLKNELVDRGKIDKGFLKERLEQEYLRFGFSDIFKIYEDVKKFKNTPEEKIEKDSIPRYIEENKKEEIDKEKIAELIDNGHTLAEAKIKLKKEKDLTEDEEEPKLYNRETLYLKTKEKDGVIDTICKTYLDNNKIVWEKIVWSGFNAWIPDPMFYELDNLTKEEKEILKEFELDILERVIDELIELDKSKKKFIHVYSSHTPLNDTKERVRIGCESDQLGPLVDKFVLGIIKEYKDTENTEKGRLSDPSRQKDIELFRTFSTIENETFIPAHDFGSIEKNKKLHQFLLDFDSKNKNVLNQILNP